MGHIQHNQYITEQQIIDKLKELYVKLGKSPTLNKSIKQLHKYGITAYTIIHHFGGWNDALLRAEIPLNKKRTINKSPEQLINDLKKVNETLSSKLKLKEWQKILRRRGKRYDYLESINTYYSVFGAITKALESAEIEYLPDKQPKINSSISL